MTVYQSINDQRYNFIPQVILRNSILKAGRRKVIFVEGYDDRAIFNILFEGENTDDLFFLDLSLKEERAKATGDDIIPFLGGCQAVKDTLALFVHHIDERRFYGVIDRDLKTDEERSDELHKDCYDKRLFIFYERYTIENYFIEVNVLATLFKELSINNNKLLKIVPSSSDEKVDFEKNMVKPCLNYMAIIAAANCTINFFNQTDPILSTRHVSHIPEKIPQECIESRLVQHLKTYISEDEIIQKFHYYKSVIDQSTLKIHQFASAKKYFAYQFNIKVKQACGADIQINNHKALLARITAKNIPEEFSMLLSFLRGDLSFDETESRITTRPAI